MLVRLGLRDRLCSCERRHRQLQPAHHRRLRLQSDQDGSHGHDSGGGGHGGGRHADCHLALCPESAVPILIVSALIGLAGAVMVHTLDINEQRDASLAGVYILGFYNDPWVFMLSLNSSNAAGATKKSFMGITVAVCYGEYYIFLVESWDCQWKVKKSVTNFQDYCSCWKQYWPAIFPDKPGTTVITRSRGDDVRFRPYGRVRSCILPAVHLRKQATQLPARGPRRFDTRRIGV